MSFAAHADLGRPTLPICPRGAPGTMGMARDLEVPDICTALSARTDALAQVSARGMTVGEDTPRGRSRSLAPPPPYSIFLTSNVALRWSIETGRNNTN